MPSRNIIVFFLSGVCVFLGGGNCVRKSDFYFSQLPPLKPLSQKKAEQFDDQPCADFSQIEPFTVAITSVLPRLVKSGGTLYLNAKANPVFGFVTYLWKIQGNKSGVTDSEGNCQLQIPEINGCDDQLTISVIATDEKGRTAEAQAHIMVSKTWCTYQFKEDQLLSNGITKLALSDDGAIWVGTVEGLNRFDGDKWNAITAANSVLGHSPNFPEGRNYINALFVHKNKSTNEDEVWVGACESENYNCAGAQRFIWKTQEKKTADWTRYSKENGNLANPYQNLHSNVIQVIASDKGKIFLGTDNGIDVIDPDKPEQKSSYLIRGYGVNAILLENEEEWYGTRASYLSVGSIYWRSRKKETTEGWLNKSIWGGKTNGDVSVFVRDGKNIYIGLQQGGMVRKSSKWELFTKEENSNMPGNDIRKMVVGKIQQIEMNGKKLNTSPIWVATATGLGRFIPQKDTESKGDWESASFRSVAVKMQGGLQTDDLTDLVYDKASETLWIATNGGGLTRLRVGLL